MKKESSIITTLRMVLIYVLVLIIGTAICAAVYTAYSLCIKMVAGGGVNVFNLGYFLTGVNKFFPLVVVLCGAMMCFYLIRYSIVQVIPLVTVVAAIIATWVFLIPLNYTWLSKYAETHPQTEVEKSLTSDYFRVGKTGAVFYYCSVEDGSIADGVCIDPENQDDKIYTFSNVSIPKSKGASDSLIHKSIGMPKFVEILTMWSRMFFRISHQAWKGGFLAWLCFSSIGLALASVVGLCSVSKWRMVNLVMVCMSIIGILVLNIMAYTQSFMDPAKAFLEGAMSKLPIKNPLIVIMNVLIFVVFSLLGFIMQQKYRKALRLENEDPYGRR